MERYGSLFEWPVADDYAWISNLQYEVEVEVSHKVQERVDDKSPWLVEFGGRHSITPLSDPTLHRKFSELKPDEASVREFANRHGLLGLEVVLYEYVKGRHGKPARSQAAGESLSRWKAEIRQMVLWLHIWDLIQEKNAGRLGQLVVWPNPNVVMLRADVRENQGAYEVTPHSHGGSLPNVHRRIADNIRGTRGWNIEAFRRWRQGDAVEPARLALYDVINEKLTGQVSLQLAWLGFENVEPYTIPRTLLSAMWLMFMWEVIGETRLLKCPECGRWIENPDVRRKTCSGACRVHRKRRLSRNSDREIGSEGGTL